MASSQSLASQCGENTSDRFCNIQSWSKTWSCRPHSVRRTSNQLRGQCHSTRYLLWQILDVHTINLCKKINVKLFILSRCAHLFNLNFKTVLFKLFIQSHFDYCSTVFSHLSTASTTRINRCFSRAIHKLLKINIKGLNVDNQLSALSTFNILPLQLRRFLRFNMFLFSLCKLNNTSVLFNNIFINRNIKDNLILPKCHSDLLKFSFTTISIKLLNLFVLQNLYRSKDNFFAFLKSKINIFFGKSSDFFSWILFFHTLILYITNLALIW